MSAEEIPRALAPQFGHTEEEFGATFLLCTGAYPEYVPEWARDATSSTADDDRARPSTADDAHWKFQKSGDYTSKKIYLEPGLYRGEVRLKSYGRWDRVSAELHQVNGNGWIYLGSSRNAHAPSRDIFRIRSDGYGDGPGWYILNVNGQGVHWRVDITRQ